MLERLDTAEKKRIAAVYTQSLMTINLILGYFRDNSKVVYLFSCGIPHERHGLEDGSGPSTPPGRLDRTE